MRVKMLDHAIMIAVIGPRGPARALEQLQFLLDCQLIKIYNDRPRCCCQKHYFTERKYEMLFQITRNF